LLAALGEKKSKIKLSLFLRIVSQEIYQFASFSQNLIFDFRATLSALGENKSKNKFSLAKTHN